MMGNIRLSGPSFRPHAIELNGGTVRSSTVKGVGGTRHQFHEVGQFRFFVDMVEEDGGRLGLWDGTNYEAAIREAEAARRDFDIETAVRDMIGGGQ